MSVKIGSKSLTEGAARIEAMEAGGRQGPEGPGSELRGVADAEAAQRRDAGVPGVGHVANVATGSLLEPPRTPSQGNAETTPGMGR